MKKFEKEKSRPLKSLRASKDAFRQQMQNPNSNWLIKIKYFFLLAFFFAFSKNIHLT